MKIRTITNEHRNDFWWIPECEHCGAVGIKRSGYHDNYFHTKVIPSLHCESCGLNRAGEPKPLGDMSAEPMAGAA